MLFSFGPGTAGFLPVWSFFWREKISGIGGVGSVGLRFQYPPFASLILMFYEMDEMVGVIGLGSNDV